MERLLAFLDTWTVVESDGSISMKVFRKDTDTDQYLNFSSSHSLEHKRGFVRTLMNRADRLVSDETELGKETEHIRKALQVNSYPDWMLVDSQLSDQLDPEQEEGRGYQREGRGGERSGGESASHYNGTRRPMCTSGQNEIPSGVAVCQRDLRTVEDGVQIFGYTSIFKAN